MEERKDNKILKKEMKERLEERTTCTNLEIKREEEKEQEEKVIEVRKRKNNVVEYTDL